MDIGMGYSGFILPVQLEGTEYGVSDAVSLPRICSLSTALLLWTVVITKSAWTRV